jgi:hypothetical protein
MGRLRPCALQMKSIDLIPHAHLLALFVGDSRMHVRDQLTRVPHGQSEPANISGRQQDHAGHARDE